MVFFTLVDGRGCLEGRVCSRPVSVVGAGLNWALSGEIVAIGLAMGHSETILGFIQFIASFS